MDLERQQRETGRVVKIVDGLPVPEYRVTALRYRFLTDNPDDHFDNAAPQSGAIGSFKYTLAGGTLRAEPTIEFLDREDAKAAIAPHLRSWEQSAYLEEPGHRITFAYEGSEIEEINPMPGFKFAFAEEAVGVGSANVAAVVTRENQAYPAPDAQFIRTPLTDRLTERLRRARDRESELTSAAYFVLSTLEHEFGGPKENRSVLAASIAVDRPVLDTLGDLSSRCDPDQGRKGKGSNPSPLTANEMAWMRATMIRLIRRAGEHAAGGALVRVTLTDLPPLP
jgi:hypothetical protein